jgi:hypothetical protein
MGRIFLLRCWNTVCHSERFRCRVRADGRCSASSAKAVPHPHPNVPKVLPLSSPLAAAVLISPWVTFASTFESFKRSKHIDVITPELGSYWGICTMGEGTAEWEIAAGCYHAEAKLAPKSWWGGGLSSAVGFVGTAAGAFEAFVDDIVEFDKNLNVNSGVKSKLYIGPEEIHDGPLLDFSMGRAPSDVSVKVAAFLDQRFKAKL